MNFEFGMELGVRRETGFFHESLISLNGEEVAEAMSAREKAIQTKRAAKPGVLGSKAFDLPLQILFIDDIPTILDLVERGLTRLGQIVLTAPSGPEGLRIFKELSVDAVVCDLVMPGMNGWAVGRGIREFCREQGVAKPPFILITGMTDLPNESELRSKSGVDAVVAKPLDLHKMLQLIWQLLIARRAGGK